MRALGGHGETSQVVNEMLCLMTADGILKSGDLEKNESGQRRCENMAREAYTRMKKRGLFRTDASRGMWVLSRKGWIEAQSLWPCVK